jgi:dUTPase
MVIKEIPPVVLNVVDKIDTNTDRGDRGFGSTSIVK